MLRDKNNQIVAGVCAGIANEIDIDPFWVRVLFVILMPTFGIGLLIYILLAIIMSDED